MTDMRKIDVIGEILGLLAVLAIIFALWMVFP